MTNCNIWTQISPLELSEAVQSILITIDVEGRVAGINNAGCEILNVSREQSIGKDWIENFVEEGFKAFASQAINKLLTGEQETISDLAYHAITPGGQSLQLRWTKRVVKDKNGDTAGILASGIPIPIAHNINSDERIRLALMSGKIGVYFWDVVHRKGIWNEELKNIFELPAGEEHDLGAHWKSILHPEDRDFVLEGMQSVMKDGKPFKKEYRLLFPDGRIKYVLPSSELILNSSGEVIQAVGTIVDITERKEIQQKLEEQKERLQLIMNATKIGYHDLDLVTGRRFWDENIHEILKIDPSSDVDRLALLFSVLHPEDKQRVQQRIAHLKSPDCGETTFDEKFRICVEGKTKYFNSKGIIVRDDQGNCLRMLGSVLEFTEQIETEQKLLEREEKYRTLFENANDAILVMENECFIECNPLALELYGCARKEELIGKTPFDFSPPLQPDGMASEEKGRQYIQKVLDGQPQRFYWLHCKLNDKSKPIHVEVSLNAFGTANKTYVLATVRDITERMKMLEVLRNSEQQYKTLVETSLQSICIIQHEKIAYINSYAVELTGYSEEEVYAMSAGDISYFMHPNDLDQVLRVFDIKREDTRNVEFRLKVKSGEYRWFRSLLKVFVYNGHPATLVTSIDITGHIKAREQIIANAVLTEDRERTRLATELHDGLGQMLTAISLHLGAINNVDALDEKSRKNYYDSMKMIRQAMDENRSISHNLMPQAIADYGYVSAAEHMINDLNNSSNLKLEFLTNLKEERLPEHLETNLYRITQEILNNVIRHAQATAAVVQLMKYSDLLILTIEDDGIGFDQKKINPARHLGLQNIHTRAEVIGGTLEIDSLPGKGTSITLQIALTDEY